MPNAGRTTSFPGAVPAVLVVRGERSRVVSWVERGTVPCYVLDLPGPWCGVVPAGAGHARAPYTDPALTLAARTTPVAMRPTLAFLPDRNRAICVVQARRWRALPRWFVVQQGVGPVRAELPQASRQDLLAAVPGAHAEAFDRVLAQVDAAPLDMLRGIMAALDVPAGHLLDLARRDDVEGDVVEPRASAVRRFDKHVRDETEERLEVEAMEDEDR